MFVMLMVMHLHSSSRKPYTVWEKSVASPITQRLRCEEIKACPSQLHLLVYKYLNWKVLVIQYSRLSC